MSKITWDIDKQFDFCYGHRVWNQSLNSEYSVDTCLKCRHLHGHQGKIKVHLSVTLDQNNLKERIKKGMVTDFKHLNWFKKWVDDVLDHKIILDVNDPIIIDELNLYYVAITRAKYKLTDRNNFLNIFYSSGFNSIISHGSPC